jgi:hypothetical protein
MIAYCKKLPVTVLAIVICVVSSQATEDYSNWLHSKYLYINTTSSGANVSGNVLNFTVLIRLKGSDLDFSQVKAGGADIRFAKSNGTHLAYQIERYVDGSNNQDTAEIWVKVDTIYGNDNTRSITMFWGSSNAADSSNASAVFDTANGFVGTWHLNNDPSGTAPQIVDATKNAINGTSYGSMISGDLLNCLIGKGIHFDGIDDRLNFGNGSKVDITGHNSLTFALWVKFKEMVSSSRYDIMKKGDHQYGLQKINAADNKVQFVVYDNYWRIARSNNDVDTSNWFYLTGVYNGSNDSVFLYVNGSKQTIADKASGGISSSRDDALELGRCSETQGSYFPGKLDEAVLSKVARTGDWIKLCYENQKSNQTLISLQGAPSAGENYSLWLYNKNITLNTGSTGANITSALYKFPVLVRLTRDNFNFSEAQANAGDIRFSKPDSAKTPLSYEIERWDQANKVAEIWVKIDTVKASDSTQYFIMYWGKSDALSKSDGKAVFDTANSFVGAWHLNNNPSGTAPQLADAAGNLPGTSYGSMPSTDLVNGIVGKGIKFDGTNDYLDFGNGPKVDITGHNSMTFSTWVKFDSLNTNISQDFIKKGDHQYGFQKVTGSNKVQFVVYSNSWWYWAQSNGDVNTSGWYLVTGVYNGSNDSVFLYLNGTKQTNVTTAPGGISSSRDDALQFGRCSERQGYYFNGKIDQTVLSKTARSAAWIKLCYENQKSNQTLVRVPAFVENYATWPYSQRIYFNTTSSGANIMTDVSTFPFLVRLSKDNFNFYQASSNGSDIRFSDPDGTHLPYEIETWDQVNQKAIIWVKVPKIDGNSTSDFINLHYGKYNAGDMSYKEAVWDSTFAGVWHLDENPNDTIRDGTANMNIGISHGSMTALDRVSGAMGAGMNFNGTDAYLDMGNTASLNIGNTTKRITFSAWVNFAYGSINGNYRPVISMGDHSYTLQLKDGGTPQKMKATVYDGGWESGISNNQPVEGTWYHFAGVYDGTNVTLYMNGYKQTSTAASGINSTAQNFNIGRNSEATTRLFKGVIDEIQVSNIARDSNWIKLAYENQKPDSKLQTTPAASVDPIFDGTMRNYPDGFIKDQLSLKIVHNDSLNPTVLRTNMFMRFDLKEYAKLKNMGWTLENAMLRLTVDSLVTPLYQDSVYVGVESKDRMIPVSRKDGFRIWREDASMWYFPMKMEGTTYAHGVAGQPDSASNGNWSWLLYDFKSEMRRLGFASVDSISWMTGMQNTTQAEIVGICETRTKTSSLSSAPAETLWEKGGTGIARRDSTLNGEKNIHTVITSGLDSLRWIWLSVKKEGSDTNLCGDWADFKVYGKRYRDAHVQIFQVKDDGIDTNYISFVNRGHNLPWRHPAVECDYANGDSSEGIGTEDLVQVFPGHRPLWNRYKGKYRSRSPVASTTISGLSQITGDSSVIYVGVDHNSRLLPVAMANGYFPFREDRRADNASALKMNDTVYSTGIGGTANGSGNYPYLLYDLRSESSRLNFGRILAVRGLAGYNDSSSNVEVFVKSCTTSTQPSLSDWINNTNGVKQRVHHTTSSGPHYATINITTDSSGGGPGSVSNIKWLWISVYSSSGNGSTSYGTFADLRIYAKPNYTYSIAMNSAILNQVAEKALEDTTQRYVTLLGISKDSGSVISISSSRNANLISRPKLDLLFSDSRTLLSWGGRNKNVAIPMGDTFYLPAIPSIGDGRYGRVLRFHNSNQYAQIPDSGHIDYSQGMMSFWYQMDMGVNSDSGANAVLFKRDATDGAQFKLQRDARTLRLNFYYGDTTADSTGTNRMIWSCVDSSSLNGSPHYDTIVNPFDGRQHFFHLFWNYSNKTAALFIDTVSNRQPVLKKYLKFSSNPASWTKGNLNFGLDIDGYIENLLIRSKTVAPAGISIAKTRIEDNLGYLPFIQPAFKDTVDCVVISPDDPLFKDILDKYAMRNISMGVRTVVVPLKTITRNYSGMDVQEKIRIFLKRAYLHWHIKTAILGAGTDYIPARKVAFPSQEGHSVTTDRYYACLEGTWNDNGNAYFAEPQDNPDLTAELTVARLPANTWNQLNSMVEKATMGIGLFPYKNQCLGNADTVALTGIQMFDNIGDVSDGHYYGKMLQDVFSQGSYTKNVHIKSYYPQDSPGNDTMNNLTDRLDKFMSKLNPLPSLWVHFGHGSENEVTLDWMKPPALNYSKELVLFTGEAAYSDTFFNHFKGMAHFRMVGCGAASQDQNSVGRMLLAKPHGGALTFIGTENYTYPGVEAAILRDEFNNIADSSLFTWGEVFKKSAEEGMAQKNDFDIYRWVILSRNFLGDPFLPVRYRSLADTDGLYIDILGNKQAVKRGKDSIVVTVKDHSGKPVEGALVGLVSQKTDKKDILTTDSLNWQNQFRPIKDMAFASGITNKQGQASFSFTTSYEDSVTITAIHNDYYAGRKNVAVGDSNAAYLTFDHHIVSYPVALTHKDEEPLNGPGAEVAIFSMMKNVSTNPMQNVTVTFSRIGSPAQDGIYITEETLPYNYSNMTMAPGDSLYVEYLFKIDSCPAGENLLPIKLIYTSNQHNDNTIINVPIVGPKIIPVISYLKDSDSNYVPDNGDFVRMQILLGNRYPVAASGVRCSLHVNNTHIQLIHTTTNMIDLVYPDSSKMDTNITYNVTGGYDENTNGIIPATLFIKGTNIPRDSINIDLNPIRNVTLKIDTSSIVVDYKGGVTLSWNGLKSDTAFGRRSDFLGYVVMRRALGAPVDSPTTLLTPWAVGSGNFFYDILPDNAAGNPEYTYYVAAVDSSFNCSAGDSINVAGPWKYALRKGFPIYIGGFGAKPPMVADYNKDGIAEIYSITPGESGDRSRAKAIGFRPDGQEAVVNGRNDGLVYDHHASNIAWADLDGDGKDEAVFTAGDTLIVRHLIDTAGSWARALNSGHSYGLEWYCRPVIADIDNDGSLEIILYGLDNSPVDNVPSGKYKATSLYVFKGNGILKARNDFSDMGAYQNGIAVGDFGIVMRHDMNKRLYLLKDLVGSPARFDTSNSVLICDTSNGKVLFPNSPITVGMLKGLDAASDVVVNVADYGATNPHDTLKVYEINGAAGFSLLARAAVPFKMFSQWTGSAALGDLDTDGIDEIVFASDDTLYLFKYETGDTLTHIAKIPFGSVPSNRLDIFAAMPQPLITNIGHGNGKQIIVNHYGDGKIWAFDIRFDGNVCHWSNHPGFPLVARGRISNACAVTDLEGDDTLDLVAVDDGGYMYAWKLGYGSIYRQPWPYDFGNVWGTGNTQYKPSGNVGYVFSDWTTGGVSPYFWFEYDVNNSTSSASGTFFHLIGDSLWVRTNGAQDRNMFYIGPNMKNMKNYTIQGKIKFDDASAEFGINFYGQWPDSSKKYSIIKGSDGLARLYYYSGAGSRVAMATLDTTLEGGNSALVNTSHWYNYEIITLNGDDSTTIRAKFWIDTIKTKPTLAGIDKNVYQNLSGGVVGLVTHAGTGYRYWGPMKVISSVQDSGAYLAFEDFKEDTIVDVKPYTPANFHPNYTINQFTIGTDTSGFVLDNSGSTPALAYRHKPGTQYPVTCMIAPNTNLEWRNYEFCGTIIKPVGSVYDTVSAGFVFYNTGESSTYKLKCSHDSLFIEGGGFNRTYLQSISFSAGDTLGFRAIISTQAINEVPDKKTDVQIWLQKSNQGFVRYFNNSDITQQRFISGYPGFYVDLSSVNNFAVRSLLPIKITNVTVRKD